MVDLDGELANVQSRTYCADQADDFRVGNHGVERPRNVNILSQPNISLSFASYTRLALTACENSRILPLLITGLSLLYTFPTCQSFAWLVMAPPMAR